MSTDIELYPRDQTDFSHHGYALDDISNDIVTWQLNAKFTLTFDYPMFSEHAGDLVAENIVRVPVPGGKAAFRIAQVIKSMGHLSITAYHVFWDLNDDFIADTNIVDKDGQGALDQIMRAANYPTGFKVLSTIGNVTNARLVRMSIIKALLGTDDNSFLNRWGGEFDWQDFSFSVNPRLGKDRGVHFEYAHNLTGYEATKDSSGIITRLLPEGYNGLLLPELYVDSPKLGNYRKPKIGAKTYQDIKAIDETQATGDQKGAVPVQKAYELLRAAATKEFSESHIDEARWTYKLNVALLENTEEYKDLSITTTVLPGDTVTITHKLDGIDVRARLTGYTWQPSNHSYLTQTYDSASRPDVAYSNLSSRLNEIKSQIELVDKVVIAKATNGMNSTGWGDQSPVDLNIAGKTGDVYYQTTAKGTIMWLFHDGQWNAETGDAFGTEVQKKVDTAIADVAAAKQAANDAVAKANSSAQLASMSNQTAQAAKSAADSANALATQAVSAASDAKTALATANSALETATDQKTTVATLVTKTDDLAGTIATLATKTDINKLSGEVTAAQTLAQQTADGLQLKADQSVVNTINGSVNQLSADLKVANDRLSLTMTKNDVTGLLTPYATQSWTQGQITATAGELSSKITSVQNQFDNSGQANLLDDSEFMNDFGKSWRIGARGSVPDGATKDIYLSSARWDVYQSHKAIVIHAKGLSANGWLNTVSSPIAVVAGTAYSASVHAHQVGNEPLDNGALFGIQWYSSLGDAQNDRRMDFTEVSVDATGKTYVLNGAKAPEGATYAAFKMYVVKNGWVSFTCPMLVQADTIGKYNSSKAPSMIQYSTLKQTADGISSTVGQIRSDLTTATNQFSSLTQRLDGFQTVVNGAATKAEVTQLSNQLTSVVGGIGQRNLVYNSEITSLDGWTTDTNIGIGTNQYDSFNGSNSLAIRGTDTGGWRHVFSKPVNVIAGQKYSCMGTLFFTGALGSPLPSIIFLEIDFFDANGTRVGSPDAAFDMARPYDKQVLKLEGITAPKTAVTVQLAVQVLGGTYNFMLNHPMLVASPTVGPYQPDTIGSSQFTQLQDAINFRVTKDRVINQINISSEGILIDGSKVHITGQTSIDNAVIRAAMIESVSASSITTGTLNAANLNVINLNASAIVTGTIYGPNLAINLNTGMVEFQKGRIHSTDNNIDINIDQKYISVTDSNNSVLLKGGSMTFTQPYAFDTDQTPYLTIDNVGSSQTLGRGAEIVGRDVLTVSVSGENNSFLSGVPLFQKDFSGISISKNYDTVVGGANRGVRIIGGGSYSTGLGMSTVPSIMVGYNDGAVTGKGSGGTRINIEADYVHIPSAWSKTTSSSPNAFVASDGALVRSTSASKYKVNIKRDRSTELAEQLLTLPTAHWLDKAAMERYASGEQKELPQTNFGLIAEDLEAAGLEDLVVRGPDGELEGIQYDRIAAALLPLLAQMKTEIDELKATA
ncbi:phage tail protein [Lacticaseibacillus paracasei]|uniref:phage tail spike protein n=1 Tax=Lacticaseibacillus paracasei TaxID=1597 RepID=UPI001C1E0C9E|nr:phage tail spike protein [Lacticaseibacillus paracasei]MBU6044084.1 phage tail protein [Lacticaseibacillus paracasei]MCL4968941.1 phage tail protein [Lacticaseibacillus paracasei]